MINKLFVLVLGALLTIPCVLRAEETEIQLSEVIEMTPIQGDSPLDDCEPVGETLHVQQISVQPLTAIHCPLPSRKPLSRLRRQS